MKPSTHTSKEVLPTQGEWKWSDFSYGLTVSEVFGTSTIEISNGKEWIARVRGNGKEQAEANAELIVKAVNERQKLLEENEALQKQASDIAGESNATVMKLVHVEKQRQKLLDSNRELLEALTEMLKWKYCYNLRPEETEAFKDVISKSETAINNAKNLQS